jgi:hypothetical protein
LAEFSQTSTSLWRTGLSGGAPDSVQCPGWPSDELVALENSPRTPRLKFTGLSGEPTTPAANGRQRDQRATHGRANGRLVTPDCPVCTIQCPMRQRDRRSNDRLRLIRKEIGHRTVIVHVRCTTRQKARIAFQLDLQRLLAAMGL